MEKRRKKGGFGGRRGGRRDAISLALDDRSLNGDLETGFNRVLLGANVLVKPCYQLDAKKSELAERGKRGANPRFSEEQATLRDAPGARGRIRG